MSEKECIVVAGPTAVGKTSYAIQLAEKFKTEIISADSRQCYQELNIGVARPDEAELQRVKHYFIANHSVTEHINAATFAKEAALYLDEILSKHNKAVLCGGTDLYIKALVDGMDDIPEIPEAVRNEITAIYTKAGLAGIQKLLDEQDPAFKLSHDFANPNRVMRALEVVMHTGLPIAHFQRGETKKAYWKEKGYVFRFAIMEMPRATLYERINFRVDQMIAEGLEEEVRALTAFKHFPALKTVGYQEFFDYFDGSLSFGEAVDKVKQHTRNYAKRQMTWFSKVKSKLTSNQIYNP